MISASQKAGHNPLIAGLDIGTTNIKAILFTPTGQVVAEAGAPTPTHYPRPGWAYYEPEEMWQATATALRQVTGQVEQPQRIAGVAVASMGEAAVPLDAHGQPTYNAIAWFDQRTQPQVEWLAQEIGADQLFAVSGLSLEPIFGLCKLLWIKQNEPAAYAKTARWLNMADYIAYRLSGEQATDYSLASRTLALNLNQLRWEQSLLQALGIAPDIFAPLLPSGTVLGQVTVEATEATGLPASTQVATGGHDHVCGALALGIVEPGNMVNSLGTAEALFLPLTQPLTDPQMGRQGYTQGAHVITGHHYVFGGVYTSGASVEWWRDMIGRDVAIATLIAEAEQTPPGSLGSCFLPHLRFASPPHNDPKSRGAFIGLSTDVKRGTLFRAVLEGLAYESRYTLEGATAYDQVMAPSQIYAIGGNTRNQLLMQIKASVLNQSINIVEATEATCLGAAILGGLGAKVYPDVPAALAQIEYAQTAVEPIADHAEFYDRYFNEVYRHLYQNLRELNHTTYEILS